MTPSFIGQLQWVPKTYRPKKKKKKRPIILEPAVFSGFLLAAPRVGQTQ